MFLNSHLRLAIPASLGDVVTFSRQSDAGIKVPAIIAFMNDGDQDVVLHFDAANNRGQATTTVDGSGGYTAFSSANQLSIAIDGEAAVTVTVSTATRAGVIAAINTALLAAGGNAALAMAILVGTKYIAVVSGTTGLGSSVEIKAVTNSAYADLGFTVGVYTPDNSFQLDIVAQLTVVAKGNAVFTNPRPGSQGLKIRGTGSGVATMIDATPLYTYSGVQQ